MAKRKKQKQGKPPAEIRLRVRKHMDALGLKSADDYFAWCIDSGFRPSADKSAQEIEQEQAALVRQRESRKKRGRRNPEWFFEQACQGAIRPDDVAQPAWREICQSISNSITEPGAREALQELLLKVYREADFLAQNDLSSGRAGHYVDALIRLNSRRGQWIRSLDSWQIKTHNGDRQFSSLLRHLLADYPVPRFMDSAWYRRDSGAYRLRDWFIHIGAGKNIRTAQTPVPLTKRMAHHFVEAPSHYSIENAIRWGQIHALGGDKRLTDALLATQLGESFENDGFWLSVIRFFIANPLLDTRHVAPIIDFINNQKFVTREVVTPTGDVEQEPPPHPNFSMRGRSADGLLARVDEWHRELGRSSKLANVYFKRSDIKPFELKVGAKKESIWRIRQLLSGGDLVAEGKALGHCVASYVQSCVSGHCSIWSMEHVTSDGTQKRQTIELRRDGMIVQCRGKFNRLPTAEEFGMLKRWADEAGLSISHYVVSET